MFQQGMTLGRPASGQETSGGAQPSQGPYAGQMTPQMLMFVQQQQQAAAALAAQQQAVAQQQRMAAQQQQQVGGPAIARPPSAGAGVAPQGIAASPPSGIQQPGARVPTPPAVPSASGRATPTGQYPPTNFTLPTRQGNENVIRHMPIPQEFLREHPAEWPAWVADPAKHAMTIYQKFLQWAVARNTLHMQAAAMQQRQQPQAPGLSVAGTQPPRPSMSVPPAKRPRMDASQVGGQPKPLSSSTGAVPQIPPSTQPPAAAASLGLRLPVSASPSPPPQITMQRPTTITEQQQQAASAALPSAASSAASALQARIQDRARPNMPPIIKPASEEDKSFLPRARAQKLIKDVCGTKVKPTPALVAALKHIAADFVTGAAAFGTAVARQRKSESLEAADLHLYFQKAW